MTPARVLALGKTRRPGPRPGAKAVRYPALATLSVVRITGMQVDRAALTVAVCACHKAILAPV